MRFADHPPSTVWEQIPLAGSPDHFIWVWYRPPALPHGILLSIPDETWRDPHRTIVLSLRNLLRSVDVPLADVIHWSYSGKTRVPESPEDHVFNEQFPPPPPPPIDRSISIHLKRRQSPPEPATPPARQVTLAPTTAVLPLFSRMESNWEACKLLEDQSEDTARQLSMMLTRVNSLNRELNFEEARFSDQADKNQWTEARRWLRDASGKITRFHREHQVSITLADAKRQACRQIYEQHVIPRIPFQGIEQADLDFEARRRALQSLLNNMKSALSFASDEAVRRAQTVLARIAGKVRSAQTKRS